MNKKFGNGWIAVKNSYYSSRTESWFDWLMLVGWVLFALCVMAFVLGCISFMFLWPLLLAWSINNLFATTIPITFGTWLSIWVIAWATKMFFSGASIIKITRK